MYYIMKELTPLEKLEIEKEQEAMRVFDVGMKDLREAIAEKDQKLSIKDKDLSDKNKLIEELERRLNEK